MPMELTRELGEPAYERIDALATAEQRARLESLCPDDIHLTQLAEEKIRQILATAAGNAKPLGGDGAGAQRMVAVRPPARKQFLSCTPRLSGHGRASPDPEEAQVGVVDALARHAAADAGQAGPPNTRR